MIGFFTGVLYICVLLAVGICITLLIEEARGIISFQQTPTTPVSMLLGVGKAEVVGRAAGISTMSPLARLPCLFWQIEVKEYQHGQRGGRPGFVLETIYSCLSGEPFMIDDGTGNVRVLATMSAGLKLGDDLKLSGRFFGAPTAEMREELERRGVKTTEFLGFRRKLFIYERRIVAGEQIYALGLIKQINRQPLLHSLYSTIAVPLILSDRSKRALLFDKCAPFGLKVLTLLVVVYGLIAGLFMIIAKW